MRKIAYIIFFMFIMIIVVPVIVLNLFDTPKSKIITKNEKIENIKNLVLINVYLHEQDKIVSMDFDEYLKGVVAAEMPASFELEALKAQATAARTYTLSKILDPQEETLKEHKGADICTNFAHCQAWKSSNQLIEMWGIASYFEYNKKIERAVAETKDMIITYNGEIINPLFHSTSGGKTENSEDVFTAKLPYLRSVVSLGEEASPKYTSKVIMSINEFKEKLIKHYPDLRFEKKDISNIKVLEYSEGGRIKNIQIGNKILTGKEIRNIFSLNSSNFKISLDKNNVIFTTTGYGHGVGMSQFGANYLAKQGKSFMDILKYYYQNVEVIVTKELKSK